MADSGGDSFAQSVPSGSGVSGGTGRDATGRDATGRDATGRALLVTVLAAFGTYFCVYGLRKPFTVAGFADSRWLGIGFKEWLLISQVLGYMLSKFVGIKVIAEMPPWGRARGIIGLASIALLSLVVFGLMPRPYSAVCLFVNGLALGLTFGLVLAFLEGRRATEALAAGLCTSFILADGVTKSVGKWLLDLGVSEGWMPAAAGFVFLVPLLVSVSVLAKSPPPDNADETARSVRSTMDRGQRRALFGRYAFGLSVLVGVYLMTTILRSLRADFMPELWSGLGVDAPPGAYTQSELWVALGVIGLNGVGIFILDNRKAFFASLLTCLAGFLLIAVALTALGRGLVSPFVFMVLIGLGLYMPYVAVHTTVFERLLAMTRERGNLGYLMYVADAFGYLGYVGVMLARNILRWRSEAETVPNADTGGAQMLDFFLIACWGAVWACGIGMIAAIVYFARKGSGDQANQSCMTSP